GIKVRGPPARGSPAPIADIASGRQLIRFCSVRAARPCLLPRQPNLRLSLGPANRFKARGGSVLPDISPAHECRFGVQSGRRALSVTTFHVAVACGIQSPIARCRTRPTSRDDGADGGL